MLKLSDLTLRPDFQLGPMLVSPPRRLVEGPAGEAHVQPLIMQVFLMLLDARGQVVTRNDLFDQVWGGVAVGEDSLNRAIAGVRRIGEQVAPGLFDIETIPRTGYRLQGDVLVSEVPAGAAQEHSPSGISRRMLVGGGVAAVGGAAGLWWIARDRTDPRVAGLLDGGKRVLREALPGSEAKGVDLFRQATKLDPGNGEAWGLLALALRDVIEQAPPSETAAAVLECESAARRALAINPKDGNALTALAMMRPEFGNWYEAEASLSHVLRVAPNNLAAMAHLGLLFQSVGRTRDSGTLNDRIVVLDPLSPIYQFRRAMRLWILGRIAEADQTIDRALQIWPRHPAVWSARMTIFAFTGRPGAAQNLLDDVRMRPASYTPASGELWRVSLRALDSGSPADVAAAVKASIESVTLSSGFAGRAVMLLSKLGELDGAFAAAEGFLLRRGPLIGSLRTGKEEMQVNDNNWRRTMILFTPATAAMRADPRFKRLCDGIGMTEYWRKRGIWPDPMYRLAFQPT
jgi:DNA-binding winged helix-turn-helix (wHTH) protein/Flp pilus assembly protein TadD